MYSLASNTKLETLEIIENGAIRIVTGLYESTPVITLHLESQISSIFTCIDFKIIKYFYKIHCSNKNNILHSLYSFGNLNWTVLLHKLPFMIREIHTCIKYDVRKK